MRITIIHDITRRLYDLLAQPFVVVFDASPRLLDVIESLHGSPQRSAITRVHWREADITIEGDIAMATAEINQTATYAAVFRDRHGAAVAVPGAVWSSSDETVAVVEAVGDGIGTPAGVVTTLVVGDCIIKCSDPDPDSNPDTLESVEVAAALFVRAGNVVVGEIAEGTFSDIPPEPPLF